MKIMVTSFKRSHTRLHSVPLTLQQATSDPCLCRRLLDTHRQVGVSLLWVHCSFLLGPGTHKVFLCVLQEPVSPVLCKFWQLHGGVNGDLPQEGLCHTQVYCTQSPYPCGRPLLTRTSARDTQTLKGSISFSMSLPIVFCSLPRGTTGSMMKVSLSISQWMWVLTLTWPWIPYWDKWASHALTRLGPSRAETLREIWRSLGACSQLWGCKSGKSWSSLIASEAPNGSPHHPQDQEENWCGTTGHLGSGSCLMRKLGTPWLPCCFISSTLRLRPANQLNRLKLATMKDQTLFRLHSLPITCKSPLEGWKGRFDFFFNFCLKFIFNWRIITLQYCIGFCHTSTWISHRYT